MPLSNIVENPEKGGSPGGILFRQRISGRSGEALTECNSHRLGVLLLVSLVVTQPLTLVEDTPGGMTEDIYPILTTILLLLSTTYTISILL